MSVINLGNDKFSINQSTAKGLERVIGIIASFIIKAQSKTDKILYGKGSRNKDPKANKFRKALDRGIIYILREISDIDFCNVLNYTVNNVKLGDKSFNPNKPPAENVSDLEVKKWTIQKKAYDYQKIIDKYYAQYGSVNNEQSRLGLINLVKSVNLAIDALLDVKNGLGDPNLIKNFPEINLIANYLNNVKTEFNSYTQTNTIPVSQIQKVIITIGKIREVLIGIQAINTPAVLIGSIDSFSGGTIQRTLNKLNNLIDAPSRLIPRIKDLIKLVNNITSVARAIAGYINLAKTLVTIMLLLVRVFNILKSFFVTLPIPGLFTTLGLTTFVGKTYQEVLEEQGTKKLIKRLSQMNLVLSMMATFVTSLLAAMDQILLALRAILLNLQNCDNVDEDLLNELNRCINNLQNATVPLRTFLNDIDNTQKETQNTFGEYEIKIIQEELVDEGISIRRRYGVAINNKNQIVVQSTPTFASLDLIIINEVKVLLVSKGFVKTGLTNLSSEDLIVIMESMQFLGNTDITLDSIQNENSIDFGNLSTAENDSDLELTSFANNLPGGAALRRRVRKKMIVNNEKLSQNLKKSDPNSTYTKNITQQTQDQTTKLKIEDLTEERERLSKALIAAVTNPILSAAIIKKIKDIDEQLKQLKNS